MMGSVVARRYALALFQIAEEFKLLDQVEEELRVVKEVFDYNEDLRAVLGSPKLPRDKKKEILKAAFGSLNQYVLNTMMLMIDAHREGELAGLADEFIGLANEAKGVATAVVYSIRPLSDEEKTGLSAAFAQKVGKKSLQIENIIDSDLLGGIRLRIGNRIYDGSLRGKLDRLERKLLG